MDTSDNNGKDTPTQGGKTGYKRPQKVLPPCTICFQEATGIHYGVPTCEACKVNNFLPFLFFTNINRFCSDLVSLVLILHT